MIALLALTITSSVFANISATGPEDRSAKEIKKLVKRSPVLNFKILPSFNIVPVPSFKKLPFKKLPLKKLLSKKLALKKLLLKKLPLKKLLLKKLPIKKLKKIKKKLKTLWNAKKLKLLKKVKKPRKLPKPSGLGAVGTEDVSDGGGVPPFKPLQPPQYRPCTPIPCHWM